MSTEAIQASALRTLEDYQASVSSSKSSGTNISVDDFLKMFVAQLSNQDPLSSSSSGGSGTDYLSQLAQLTMMQQLSEIGDSLSTSQAYGMIGKYVYIGDEMSSDLIFGRVDGVINSDGVYKLMVDGETYDLSEVYAVVDDETISAATDDKVLASAGLIGKTVTATTLDSAGAELTVTGQVEKILVQDGILYLVIGGQNVTLGDIIEITETEAETESEETNV
jgi:flagellar basal-body rod modification protein FlgD